MNNRSMNLLPISVMAIVALVAIMIAAFIEQSVIQDVFVVVAGVAAVSVIGSIVYPSSKTQIG